jgi:hypothetical protein
MGGSVDAEFFFKVIGTRVGIIGLLGTLGTLLAGVYQYAKAQKWKRSEFAAKELDKLNNDPILSLACTFLDWTGRAFVVPEAYKHKISKGTFIHDWDTLAKAMAPDIKPDDGREGFTWQEVLYRDVFDHLFTYLVLLNHYVEIGLVSKKDIFILKYWLEQITGSPLADHKPIFEGYIESFGYRGVNELSRKLGVSPPRAGERGEHELMHSRDD